MGAVFMLTFFTVTSFAVDQAQAKVSSDAQKMSAAARKAARSGKHDKAFDLYIGAFKLSDAPGFLAAAAAMEVALGRYERAYKRYEKALAHSKMKRRLRRRIRKALDKLEPNYRSAVQQRNKAADAREAAANAADERQTKAKRRDAARAQKKLIDAARADLEARQKKESNRRRREQNEETAARLQAERDWKGVAGWSALAAGAVVAGSGVWALLSYRDGQAQLNGELGKPNPADRFEALDYETYKSRQEEVNQRAVLSTVGVAVGGAALLVGAWFTLSRPGVNRLSLTPLPGGGLIFASGAL